MSISMGDLVGFAYGEDLESTSQRSLGYRLLAPLQAEPWCAEVEALARRLQAAPYPDHWPATDLFCSVLLADGRRLIALARYGLADHTPSQRRGGLELIGVVAPAGLDVLLALALYHWLQQRRAAADDLHRLGGTHRLDEVLALAKPRPLDTDPVPVLPVRLWQDGALLFAASTPADPDHHLRLLEQGAGESWQWLPLVGADFPLPSYAQRGPLVAWTPHLAGVALKVDRKPADTAPPHPPRRLRLTAAILVLLFTLLGANLWALLALHRRIGEAPATPPPGPSVAAPSPSHPPAGTADGASRERFVAALHRLVLERGGRREWEAERPALLARYGRLVRTHRDLQLPPGDTEGRVTVAAISVLAGRSADHIEELVRKALSANKGFSERLIKVACEEVHDQFVNAVRQ